MGHVLLSVAIVAVVMAIMAVGVFFSRPRLRGSCGGPDVIGPDGEKIRCEGCPNRDREPADASGSPCH